MIDYLARYKDYSAKAHIIGIGREVVEGLRKNGTTLPH